MTRKFLAFLLVSFSFSISIPAQFFDKLKKLKQKVDQVTNQSGNSASNSSSGGLLGNPSVGKFVFSKAPIKEGESVEGERSFTLKDHIYGMANLKKTISELTDGGQPSQTEMHVTVFVDGQEQGFDDEYKFYMSPDAFSVKQLSFEILPDPNTASKTEGAIIYANIFSKASARKHKITFRFSAIYLSQRSDIAEGSFELDLSEGQEGLTNLVNSYKNRASKNVFMPKPAMNDSKLEKEMLAATTPMLKRMGWDGTAMKAVIIEDGWTIYRHPISGIITDRRINGAVSVKTSRGGCKLYEITFTQEYDGSKYGTTQTHSTDNGKDIDCGNASN